MNGFSLNKKSYFPLVYVGMTLLLFAGIYLVVPVSKQSEFYIPAVAVSAGFVYFLYNQHLQETKLFADLFRQFNEKYDSLNSDLNRLVSICDEPSGLDRQIMFDYFNLCGEEYLYYKTGFIDPEVWDAWRVGMKCFLSQSHIRSLWTLELETGSYYGLTIQIIEA